MSRVGFRSVGTEDGQPGPASALERRGASRSGVFLPAKVSEHHGAAPNGVGCENAVVTGITSSGARLLAPSTHTKGELLQVQFVRPNGRQPGIGQRVTVIAQVAWTRRLGKRAERPEVPGLCGRQFAFEAGVQFLVVDQPTRLWLDELTRGLSGCEGGR